MKVNKRTAAVLAVFVVSIGALAAWGERLGMSEGALHWVQGAAGVIGMAVLAMLPAILADKDGDGIPDSIETKTTTTATVVEVETTKTSTPQS